MMDRPKGGTVDFAHSEQSAMKVDLCLVVISSQETA